MVVRQNLTTLHSLKQQMMTLRHATAGLPEAVSRLHGGRVPPVCKGLTDYFRDVYDHLLRLNQAMDDLREMIGTAISVNLAVITLSENETMKRLASYAALIAVPTLIAGIYGMNFKNMPELQWFMGYPFAMTEMAAVDGFLFVRFRRAGWL
jgi:magnesium transporter